MITKLPPDIQIRIFERFSNIELLQLTQWEECLASLWYINRRFLPVCEENDLNVGEDESTYLLMKRFLNNLGLQNFVEANRWDRWLLEETETDYGINNTIISLANLFSRKIQGYLTVTSVKVSFTFIQNEELARRKEVMRAKILSCDVHEDLEKKALVWFKIGNDELIRPETNLSYHHFDTEFSCYSPLLAFDEHHQLYYATPEQDPLMIYRKDLKSDKDPELVHVFPRGCRDVHLCVYGPKLYLIMKPGPFSRVVVYCFDMKTKKRIVDTTSFNIPFFNQQPVPYEEGLVLMTYDGRSLVYVLKNKSFSLKCIDGCRRKRLNRHTYIIARKTEDAVEIRTFTFIHGKIIEHCVQKCNEMMLIVRHTDHVFVILEEDRRTIWYEERPGDKPIRIHTDFRKTQIHMINGRMYPKNENENVFY